MQPDKQKLFFLGSVFAQFAVLFGMIFFYQAIVLGGTQVILKTRPVDPRDLLRGQYVALMYDISTVDISKAPPDFNNFSRGDTVYLGLEETAGGVWQGAALSREMPKYGIFIKGIIENKSSRALSVKYGIESYFVNPEDAYALESQARMGNLYMKIIVDKAGKAVVSGVAEGIGPKQSSDSRVLSRDARRIADISQLRLGLELYFDSDGTYPQNLRDITANIMPMIPTDPLGGNYYYVRCAKESYHLAADLENAANAALGSDSDTGLLCSADFINGDDTVSCSGSAGRFCFDKSESVSINNTGILNGRPWGPEQATGAPNSPTTLGDHQTAWASLSEDDQDESLVLSYDKPIIATAIVVYESYNPGALVEIDAITGEKTVIIWQGVDPVQYVPDKGYVAMIKFAKHITLSEIRLSLESMAVSGWNEIDAVGLVDQNGDTHWATGAKASSSYAEPNPGG